jgi:hypothetical protein
MRDPPTQTLGKKREKSGRNRGDLIQYREDMTRGYREDMRGSRSVRGLKRRVRESGQKSTFGGGDFVV